MTAKELEQGLHLIQGDSPELHFFNLDMGCIEGCEIDVKPGIQPVASDAHPVQEASGFVEGEPAESQKLVFANVYLMCKSMEAFCNLFNAI